ncbi:MAG: hypothetical protein ACODAD_01360, partial [Planctomycetota bacterium]
LTAHSSQLIHPRDELAGARTGLGRGRGGLLPGKIPEPPTGTLACVTVPNSERATSVPFQPNAVHH